MNTGCLVWKTYIRIENECLYELKMNALLNLDDNFQYLVSKSYIPVRHECFVKFGMVLCMNDLLNLGKGTLLSRGYSIVSMVCIKKIKPINPRLIR